MVAYEQVVVCAGQLGPSSEAPDEQVERICDLIGKAAAMGIRLIAFPELALTPYFPVAIQEDGDRYFDTLDSSRLRAVAEEARRGNLWVALPFAERAEQDRFNSCALFGPDGRVAGVYRKAHIPGRSGPGSGLGSYEKWYFKPGDTGYPLFELPFGRVGILICYDRTFPEVWRAYGLQGAHIVLCPYNTSVLVPHDPHSALPPKQTLREQMRLREQAGANMNGYFVIAVGKAGVERGVEYIGDSLIISPWGRVLAHARSEGDELVTAAIDPRQAEEAQAMLKLHQERRPDTYLTM